MTQGQLIAVAAFVVPCATAILVGYWHRKQMRQLELFRRDPSVGVVPPPSPPVAFFKRYWDLILGVGVPAIGVAFLMARNEPATTLSAGLISFNLMLIVYNLYLRSEMRLLKLINRTVDALYAQSRLSAAIVKGNEAQMRLTELERQKGLIEITQNTGETQLNIAPKTTALPLTDSEHD